MRLTVGTLLAIVTLIGSILLGGAQFGDLRSSTKANQNSIFESRVLNKEVAKDIRYEMKESNLELRRENMENLKLVAEMRADIGWIKRTMGHSNVEVQQREQ
jgi:hypothetical protein